MLRTTSITIVLIMGLALIMPMCVLVHFQLDRERIAKELCVQREVAEETRTCHGECHLRDQLRPLQDEGHQQAPVETNVLTLIPVFMPQDPARPFAAHATQRHFAEHRPVLAAGHHGLLDPVPKG